MRLWRLCDARFAAAALDGEGARLFGARWNNPGQRAVYLSEHLSLAALELIVNANRRLSGAYVAIAVNVPGGLTVHRPALGDLPAGWRESPAPATTRAFGSEWLGRAREALMCIPSVIIPDESNYLLNPDHPDAKRIEPLAPVPFSFDPRLFRG